jgi:hypothetical protein
VNANSKKPTTGLVAHFYPYPADPIPAAESLDILAGDDVIADDYVPRDHPEVPLTPAQRDEALTTCGYRRTGDWTTQNDSTYAPCEAINPTTRPMNPLTTSRCFCCHKEVTQTVEDAIESGGLCDACNDGTCQQCSDH